MCELLALSANTPTDMRFSFHGLRRRGGATGDHGDGWGLASFDPDGDGVDLYREDAPAAFSPIAAQVESLDLRAHCSIAHIRKATRGIVALENCHPFHRRWGGREWVFAHNGHLEGDIPLQGRFRPEGTTDSEAAFCWILDRLDAAGVDSRDPEALAGLLHRCAADLAQRGTFNAQISNGQWLFVTATTRLHWLTRRAPFRTATLVDPPVQVDFSRVTTAKDVVTILSTEPLTTDEHWHAIEPGSSMLWSGGELLCQHNP